MVIKQLLFNFINNTKFYNMKKQEDFTYSLTVKAPAKETMEKISQVSL